ncbi:hypothetical protein [Terricaulis silvestris]|uniref:Uncharacterized protein n=1 Tax=Terricaulis silvestris TaxID=2686094 RepID=A0A6I6MI30_9CAUL|nr:hypothetical protein [Terricaulis silvestris]QGZ93351.1 hypothetical protein DSM104635_00161 [Terricaulis silvestris]
MRIVFFILALLALAFWGFGVFDMWATLTGWPPYVDQYGADMVAWIQGFPVWRQTIWGASLGFGLIGSLLLFTRDRLSGPALLIAWLLFACGFGYDLAFRDGVRNYGQDGMIASGALVALAAFFAWIGYASSGPARAKPPVMRVAPASVAPQALTEPSANAPASSEITTTASAQQSETPSSEPALTQTGPAEPGPPVAEAAPPTDPASPAEAEEASSPAGGSEPTAQTANEAASPTESETEDGHEPAAPAPRPEDKPTAE